MDFVAIPHEDALVRKTDDLVNRLLQLPIDGEHRDAVHVGPDVLREGQRRVRLQEAQLLERDDGVDQHLKGGRAFLRQLGIAGSLAVDVALQT